MREKGRNTSDRVASNTINNTSNSNGENADGDPEKYLLRL